MGGFQCAIHRPGVDYTINKDGMPVWIDTPATRIIRPTIAEIKQTKITAAPGVWTRQIARDIYDKHAMDEYGPIDDDHPLVVATLLRSGGQVRRQARPSGCATSLPPCARLRIVLCA